MAGGVDWAELEAAAPELAAAGRRAVERFGFVFLATLRRDGAPRISPVVAHFVAGRLMLALIPASRKARDLARDPRVCLQSPIADPDEPGDELKLHGRVVDVGARQRNATADAIERAAGWRPAESWRVVAVSIEAAAHLRWEAGEMSLRRWDVRHGARGPERRRLDMAAGAYRA